MIRDFNVVPPVMPGDGVVSRPGLIGIPSQLWPEFQELIQRGANLWPDASPAIKELADRVTNGAVMQDYYSQENAPKPAVMAINLEGPEPVPPPVEAPWSFATAIAEFNEMYKMPSNKHGTAVEVAARLKQFKKMILDEVDEIDIIIGKLEAPTPSGRMEIMTDIADLLGDIQVFCASEMQRFDIPIDPTLKIIMDSNGSKKQEDGTALFVEGKLQKGPNYWKPEPKIEEMLREYWTQV